MTNHDGSSSGTWAGDYLGGKYLSTADSAAASTTNTFHAYWRMPSLADTSYTWTVPRPERTACGRCPWLSPAVGLPIIARIAVVRKPARRAQTDLAARARALLFGSIDLVADLGRINPAPTGSERIDTCPCLSMRAAATGRPRPQH
jgi:hypothetical protein